MQQEKPSTLPFADRHLALFAALAVVVFAALRVYFVAGFDLTTALSVLAVVDRTHLFTATVLSLVVILAPSILFAPDARRWLFAGVRPDASAWAVVRTVLACGPLAAIGLTALTPPLAGTIAIALAVRWLLGKRRASPRHEQSERGTARSWDGLVLVSMLTALLILALGNPWIARERLEISGRESVVGQVVGEQAGHLMVLGADSLWVRSDDVLERQLCRDRVEWWSATLPSLINSDEGVDCTTVIESEA